MNAALRGDIEQLVHLVEVLTELPLPERVKYEALSVSRRVKRDLKEEK